MGAGFGTVRMRAIFAGWLIALMVWLLPGTESAGASIILILTYLVGISGFNHIIRDPRPWFFLYHSVFLSTVAGQCDWRLALVAALGYAQMVGGKQEQAKAKG